MKIKKTQRGITLISLVITIIILLILAGITISTLTENGLFGRAKEAKQRSENAQDLENQLLSEYGNQIDNLGGTTGGSSFTNIDTSKTNPEAAKPSGATVVEGDATKGIVIKDSKNNEWVWVEVPKTIFTQATSSTDYNNIKADLIAYATDYRESYTDEYYDGCGVADASTYTTMYNKMLSSVYTNGGFWISRYEIGDSTATASNTTRTSDSGITGTAVSKVDQIPYNYVTCSQAQTLASGMSVDTGKTSSLLFGIQWDLVCKFLEVNGDWDTTTNTASYYIKTNSASWGNYKNNSLTLSRGKYNINPGSSSSVWTLFSVDTTNYVTSSQTSSDTSYNQLLTTGASEGTNKMNIYDFAGNESEWTLEKASDSSIPCAYRGGNCYYSGSENPASKRDGSNASSSYDNVGFHSALY